MWIYRFIAIGMLLWGEVTAHNSDKRSVSLVRYIPKAQAPALLNYISLALNSSNAPEPFAGQSPLYRRSGVKLTRKNNELCQAYFRLGKSASEMDPEYLDSITFTEIRAMSDRPSVVTITGGSGRYKRATGSGITVEEVSGYAQLPAIAGSQPSAAQTPPVVQTYNLDFDDIMASLPAPVGKYPSCLFS